MKEYMEFSAKTVDEAITKALLELEISSDRLEYEIVEKGGSGFLGIFTKPAVIRVVKPTGDEDELLLSMPVKKEDEKNVAEKSSADEKKFAGESKAVLSEAGQNAEKNEKKHVEKAAKKGTERTADKSAEKCAEKDAEKGAEKEVEKFADKTAGRSVSSPKYGKYGDRPKNQSQTSRPQPVKDQSSNQTKQQSKPSAPKQPVVKKNPLVKPTDPETLALLEKVEKFLAEMFSAMQMQVIVETGYDEEEKTINVILSGEEMGVLIGKRGQTLDSIQYLCSLVVNKGEDEYVRVKVDTENYRERRKETLESLARNISYKVKRTRRPVSLEPMNPYERRIIHAALQNDKYVVTRSEGVEPYRHIVISPKNMKYGAGKPSEK